MSHPLGPITQNCWVVTDIAATEMQFSSNLGASEWLRFPDVHFGPSSCTYRGAPADFVVDVSLAYVGELQIELIRPVRGDSIYAEFLERTGGGLHHACYEPDDFDGAVAGLAVAGWEIVQAGEMAGGLMRFAYATNEFFGNSYIEIAQISPELRALYGQIRPL
jgi:hypothetical protein